MHAARVALAAFVIVALTASGVSAGRRVTVTRATISASGVTRLSDLFALAGSWSPATNDGYTFSPTPRGLSLPRDTQWTILLNGQTLDVSTFDANPLDAVPVALAEIDSVVFSDDAAPGAAWDSGRGRVEIFALRPVSGWRAGGAVGTARWVGDVGAIRFTPDAPRGSDTVGPDASFWAMRGSARGYVALSGNLEQHPFVDPSMRRRSMSLRAGLRTTHSWHEAVATAMDAPDYIHYSEPFGRGVRADQRALLAGVSGGLQLNGAWRTRYRVAGSENRLSQSADDPVFADTWTTRRGRGGIDVERRVSRSRVGAFAALEHREVNTAGALMRNDDTFARTGAYWERRAGRAWILSADAAGTFAQGDGAATLGAGADWVVRAADTLRTRVRVSQRLFAEDDNLWLWSARGADLLANGGVAFSIDAPVTRTTVSSVDVGWTSTGVMGGLDVDLGLRRFDDAYVDQHTFALNPVACVFESPVNVVT
ncbi:MAG TPA: hypothetical protein VFX92_13035, partial [Candidatus Krumholzibacteria bacterium]|nr:hypothetical protein [Candidatus Krumholzibacteria bacterium]